MTETVLAFFGGTVYGILFGLYVGEVRVRKYIQTMQQFGTPNPIKKAEVWLPEPETRTPEERGLKLVRDEKNDGDVSWSTETIEKGTQELLKAYQAQGIGITPEQAREEVVLMLNAQGGEIEPVN